MNELSIRNEQRLTHANKTQPIRAELSVLKQEVDKGYTEETFSTLYEGFDCVETRQAAEKLFFIENESFDSISKRLCVNISTVAAWANVYAWMDRKEQETLTLKRAEKVRLDRHRLEKREGILRDQLELSSKIRQKALEISEIVETPAQLKNLAEAAKSAADVETRALGVADNGATDLSAQGEAQAAKKGDTPLVVVFNNRDGLPPLRVHSEVIDSPLD